jgi:hypothetical protein
MTRGDHPCPSECIACWAAILFAMPSLRLLHCAGLSGWEQAAAAAADKGWALSGIVFQSVVDSQRPLRSTGFL